MTITGITNYATTPHPFNNPTLGVTYSNKLTCDDFLGKAELNPENSQKLCKKGCLDACVLRRHQKIQTKITEDDSSQTSDNYRNLFLAEQNQKINFNRIHSLLLASDKFSYRRTSALVSDYFVFLGHNPKMLSHPFRTVNATCYRLGSLAQKVPSYRRTPEYNNGLKLFSDMCRCIDILFDNFKYPDKTINVLYGSLAMANPEGHQIIITTKDLPNFEHAMANPEAHQISMIQSDPHVYQIQFGRYNPVHENVLSKPQINQLIDLLLEDQSINPNDNLVRIQDQLIRKGFDPFFFLFEKFRYELITPLLLCIHREHDDLVEKLLSHPQINPNENGLQNTSMILPYTYNKPLLHALNSGLDQIAYQLLDHPNINNTFDNMWDLFKIRNTSLTIKMLQKSKFYEQLSEFSDYVKNNMNLLMIYYLLNLSTMLLLGIIFLQKYQFQSSITRKDEYIKLKENSILKLLQESKVTETCLKSELESIDNERSRITHVRKDRIEKLKEQKEKLKEEKDKLLKVLNDIKSNLECPISQSQLIDPVATTDGQIYERTEIVKWLSSKDTSPKTNNVLSPKDKDDVIPMHALKNILEILNDIEIHF